MQERNPVDNNIDNKNEDSNIDNLYQVEENQAQGDQVENQGQGDQVENQAQGDQVENQGQGDQVENQAQGDQVENQGQGDQVENQGQGDQVENQAQGDQVENQAQGDENHGQGGDQNNQGQGDENNGQGDDQNQGDQVENQGQGDQVENQGQGDQVENQGQGDQVENQAQGDQVENQGQGDQVENQGQGDQVENQAQGDQVENQAQGDENHGQGGDQNNQGQGDENNGQGDDQNQGDQVENQGQGDQVENQGQGDQVENQGQGDQVENQAQGDQVENQGQGDQVENQGQGDQVENQGQGDQVENQGQGDQVENQGQGDQVESQAQGDQVENQGQGDQVENQGQGDQVENQAQGDENHGQGGDQNNQGQGDENNGQGDDQNQGNGEDESHNGASHKNPFTRLMESTTSYFEDYNAQWWDAKVAEVTEFNNSIMGEVELPIEQIATFLNRNVKYLQNSNLESQYEALSQTIMIKLDPNFPDWEFISSCLNKLYPNLEEASQEQLIKKTYLHFAYNSDVLLANYFHSNAPKTYDEFIGNKNPFSDISIYAVNSTDKELDFIEKIESIWKIGKKISDDQLLMFADRLMDIRMQATFRSLNLNRASFKSTSQEEREWRLNMCQLYLKHLGRIERMMHIENKEDRAEWNNTWSNNWNDALDNAALAIKNSESISDSANSVIGKFEEYGEESKLIIEVEQTATTLERLQNQYSKAETSEEKAKFAEFIQTTANFLEKKVYSGARDALEEIEFFELFIAERSDNDMFFQTLLDSNLNEHNHGFVLLCYTAKQDTAILKLVNKEKGKFSVFDTITLTNEIEIEHFLKILQNTEGNTLIPLTMNTELFTSIVELYSNHSEELDKLVIRMSHESPTESDNDSVNYYNCELALIHQPIEKIDFELSLAETGFVRVKYSGKDVTKKDSLYDKSKDDALYLVTQANGSYNYEKIDVTEDQLLLFDSSVLYDSCPPIRTELDNSSNGEYIETTLKVPQNKMLSLEGYNVLSGIIQEENKLNGLGLAIVGSKIIEKKSLGRTYEIEHLERKGLDIETTFTVTHRYNVNNDGGNDSAEAWYTASAETKLPSRKLHSVDNENKTQIIASALENLVKPIFYQRTFEGSVYQPSYPLVNRVFQDALNLLDLEVGIEPLLINRDVNGFKAFISDFFSMEIAYQKHLFPGLLKLLGMTSSLRLMDLAVSQINDMREQKKIRTSLNNLLKKFGSNNAISKTMGDSAFRQMKIQPKYVKTINDFINKDCEGYPITKSHMKLAISLREHESEISIQKLEEILQSQMEQCGNDNLDMRAYALAYLSLTKNIEAIKDGFFLPNLDILLPEMEKRLSPGLFLNCIENLEKNLDNLFFRKREKLILDSSESSESSESSDKDEITQMYSEMHATVKNLLSELKFKAEFAKASLNNGKVYTDQVLQQDNDFTGKFNNNMDGIQDGIGVELPEGNGYMSPESFYQLLSLDDQLTTEDYVYLKVNQCLSPEQIQAIFDQVGRDFDNDVLISNHFFTLMALYMDQEDLVKPYFSETDSVNQNRAFNSPFSGFSQEEMNNLQNMVNDVNCNTGYSVVISGIDPTDSDSWKSISLTREQYNELMAFLTDSDDEHAAQLKQNLPAEPKPYLHNKIKNYYVDDDKKYGGRKLVDAATTLQAKMPPRERVGYIQSFIDSDTQAHKVLTNMTHSRFAYFSSNWNQDVEFFKEIQTQELADVNLSVNSMILFYRWQGYLLLDPACPTLPDALYAKIRQALDDKVISMKDVLDTIRAGFSNEAGNLNSEHALQLCIVLLDKLPIVTLKEFELGSGDRSTIDLMNDILKQITGLQKVSDFLAKVRNFLSHVSIQTAENYLNASMDNLLLLLDKGTENNTRYSGNKDGEAQEIYNKLKSQLEWLKEEISIHSDKAIQAKVIEAIEAERITLLDIVNKKETKDDSQDDDETEEDSSSRILDLTGNLALLDFVTQGQPIDLPEFLVANQSIDWNFKGGVTNQEEAEVSTVVSKPMLYILEEIKHAVVESDDETIKALYRTYARILSLEDNLDPDIDMDTLTKTLRNHKEIDSLVSALTNLDEDENSVLMWANNSSSQAADFNTLLDTLTFSHDALLKQLAAARDQNGKTIFHHIWDSGQWSARFTMFKTLFAPEHEILSSQEVYTFLVDSVVRRDKGAFDSMKTALGDSFWDICRNLTDDKGHSLLFYMIQRQQLWFTLEELLESPYLVNPLLNCGEGYTPLHYVFLMEINDNGNKPMLTFFNVLYGDNTKDYKKAVSLLEDHQSIPFETIAYNCSFSDEIEKQVVREHTDSFMRSVLGITPHKLTEDQKQIRDSYSQFVTDPKLQKIMALEATEKDPAMEYLTKSWRDRYHSDQNNSDESTDDTASSSTSYTTY